MDAARFHVKRTLNLSSRNLFFLLGDVVEGVVRIGMVVQAEPLVRGAVHAVEYADHIAERRSQVALGFRYLQAADLARWQAVPWEGATLEIAAEPILHPCPCCGFRTMTEAWRGTYDLCPVCNWEDDGVQYHDPDYRGGANLESLNEARAAFFTAHPNLAPRNDA
ncbi:MAG TPA: CPCC family cysteine-rich protein [Longimicrobium sp.]|nr:CPCC family cysteine-rich protein [Longimicrobium sp.]